MMTGSSSLVGAGFSFRLLVGLDLSNVACLYVTELMLLFFLG